VVRPGYYRRAKHLTPRRAIVEIHTAAFQRSLRRIARFGGRAVYAGRSVHRARAACGAGDGNVTRVLLRVEGRRARIGEKVTEQWTWNVPRALRHAADPGRFNEG